jgi:hypothetical protein
MHRFNQWINQDTGRFIAHSKRKEKQMTNPIQENNMFATPHDMQSLMSWIEAHTGSERVVAATAAGMAWNLAAKLLMDEEARIKAFNDACEEIAQTQEQLDPWDSWSPSDIV